MDMSLTIPHFKSKDRLDPERTGKRQIAHRFAHDRSLVGTTGEEQGRGETDDKSKTHVNGTGRENASGAETVRAASCKMSPNGKDKSTLTGSAI